MSHLSAKDRLAPCMQGDHLSGKPGKPGNVREFETCQGNVTEKNLVREKCPKSVHYWLNICVHMGI